jgi:hypothetical protein
MGKAKPEGWTESLKDMIATGKNWKTCDKELRELYGDEEGKLGSSTFQKHKTKLTGGTEVDNNLKELGDIKREGKPEKKKTQRPPWNKGKQNAADTSKLAILINKGMYSGLYPFCLNKKLTEADVQDINLGGAVVGTVQYMLPDVNLEHPIILLATRGIMLYLTFKRICGKIGEIKQKLAHVGGDESGIAGGWKGEAKPNE